MTEPVAHGRTAREPPAVDFAGPACRAHAKHWQHYNSITVGVALDEPVTCVRHRGHEGQHMTQPYRLRHYLRPHWYWIAWDSEVVL